MKKIEARFIEVELEQTMRDWFLYTNKEHKLVFQTKLYLGQQNLMSVDAIRALQRHGEIVKAENITGGTLTYKNLKKRKGWFPSK